MQTITLYFRQGGSDKVYQARIVPENGGYVVTFAYGRRGTTLQTGRKMQNSVSLEEATAIYEKVIKEKLAKGYTPGEHGTPYQHTGPGKEHTGIHCQLLNPVDEQDVQELLGNQTHAMQEKHDGRRLMLQKVDTTIRGINRLGLTCGIPLTIEESALAFDADFIIDGEAVGNVFHTFDILTINGQTVHHWAYRDRYLVLVNLLGSMQTRHIKLVETKFMPEEKRAFFNQLDLAEKEGVVFKQVDAPYTAGRPASGGTQLKHKFVETASFIVNRINEKSSVSLMLFDGDKVVPAGNVTIPVNHAIPAIGSVVEVRYLYAFRESGSIFQPVYLGRREDITAQECVVSQLKFKDQDLPVAA